VGTLPDYEWGFTGIFARENGGGFLTDHYPIAQKAIWDIQEFIQNPVIFPDVKLPEFHTLV
jgi:formamidase